MLDLLEPLIYVAATILLGGHIVYRIIKSHRAEKRRRRPVETINRYVRRGR